MSQSHLCPLLVLGVVFGCTARYRRLLAHHRMSAQSMYALLCLGAWSKLGYMEIDDLTAAASLPDVGPDEIWLDEELGVVVV